MPASFLLPLFLPLLLLLPLLLCFRASGFGSMGPISAAFGDDGFFCAIDASGKQNVICWTRNTTLPSPSSSSSSTASSAYFNNIPPMAALSGGEGFLCGILANTSQAFCWSSISSSSDLVPAAYRTSSYSHVAAGKNHVCAIQGFYYSDQVSGSVDCWEIVKAHNNNSTLTSLENGAYYDQSVSNLVFSKLVSGEGYTCGRIKEGGITCWGPNSSTLGLDSQNYLALASGRGAICGILEGSYQVKCWGNSDVSSSSSSSSLDPPIGTRFVSLAVGAKHFCGIRADNHAIHCWGTFNSSYLPKGGSGFTAIASSDFTTCGIRENDLVIDCWSTNGTSPPQYNPPLELCSPGLCSPADCSNSGEFAFNASSLNEPELTSLCSRKELKICSLCGSNCSDGYFLSSPCLQNSDRVCTACSLCQNSSCWDVCGMESASASSSERQWHRLRKLVIIIGCSVLGFLLILLTWYFLPRLIVGCRKDEGEGKPEFGSGDIASETSLLPTSAPQCPGMAQIFRLSELKDATNGFKEFNELGRGSYGFVYKAVLTDGRLVAVKRANATTIIHTTSRDFEMELEVLCNVRHFNIVNLLGYCSEMGERLLVYEYMHHGALHDHLHSGLSPLNWSLRLKIAFQAAKGLEFLHKGVDPPIVHGNVKTSNILLDSEWGARIADFGLVTANEKDHPTTTTSTTAAGDVYSFGIVLLEMLSGRKAYGDDDCSRAPSIREWAVPLIKQDKAAAILDRYVGLPRNVEPLLKLADIAELAVRESCDERPTMSEVAVWLEQIVKDGLTL